MTRPQACPDESILRDFLQDQLAGADAERIDDHIGGCPACQRALDRLIGSLPGRWLPDPDGAQGDAPGTHAVNASLGVMSQVHTRSTEPEGPAGPAARPGSPDTPTAAEPHLLFGLLALQNGMINQGQLLAACHAWTLDKSKRLAEHLEARGDLSSARRAVLEALAEVHREVHGDDLGKSLEAVPVGPAIREGLAQIGDPEINTTLGHVGSATGDGQRFRVLRPHARGGLGAVFVALDSELNREVALKRILDHHADDHTSRARFLLEAEVTGGLEHPGIVPVYGMGTYRDGRPYYAMRLIRGDSLKQAIERFHADVSPEKDPSRRSLELRKLLRQFLDVCNAIEYAHSRGVLHRDIKPGNIIVGKHGETLVVDWGLAKARGRSDGAESSDERPLIPSSASGSSETLPGSTLGTPAFMSPEQAAGDLEAMGPSSDVYSLGATLYSLLTGRPPVPDGDISAVLCSVQKGDFRPPRQLDPTIDRALEAVCLRAMSLKPGDRYLSTRALADDVERWIADEPVSAYREPLPGRLSRWGRRHRTLVAATALSLVTAVALLTALVVAVRIEQGRTDLARRMAEANYRDARGAVFDYLTSVSEEALLDEPGMQPLRQRLLQSALAYHRRFIERRANDPDAIVDLARSQAALANVSKELGGLAESIRGYEAAIRLHRELDARRPGDPEMRNALAECYLRMAEVQNVLSRQREALENCDGAIGLLEALVADRPADVRSGHNLASAVFTKAQIKHADERIREAAALYERAASLQEEVVAQSGGAEGERASLAFYAYRMSSSLANTGRAAQGKDACLKAIGLYEGLMRDHPRAYKYRYGHAMALRDLGHLESRSGRWADFARYQEQARTELADLVRDNPDVFSLRQALAMTDRDLAKCYLVELGQRDRGAAALRNAIQGFQSTWREDTPATTVLYYAFCLQHLATIQSQDRQYVEAHANRRRACELLEQVARKTPDNLVHRGELADAYGGLADISERLGLIDEAAGLYRQAITMMRSIFSGGIGHDEGLVAQWTFGLSRILRTGGRLDEAADMLDSLARNWWASRMPCIRSPAAYRFARRMPARVGIGRPSSAKARGAGMPTAPSSLSARRTGPDSMISSGSVTIPPWYRSDPSAISSS